MSKENGQSGIAETCDVVGMVNSGKRLQLDVPSIMQLIGEKAKPLPVMLMMGWEGRFVFGNKLNRRKIADVLMPKLRAALELYERPASVKSQRIRAAQVAR